MSTVEIYHFDIDAPREAVLAIRFAKGDGETERLESLRSAVSEAYTAGHYNHVATFQADSVGEDAAEEAWLVTQNGGVSDSWSRRPPPGITPAGTGVVTVNGMDLGYKSSDVGDIFVVDGEVFVCANIGFEKVADDLPSLEGEVPQP